MATPVDAKQRAMSTYNAAADFYDHPWRKNSGCLLWKRRLRGGPSGSAHLAGGLFIRQPVLPISCSISWDQHGF
jgi:hypothetical protein